MCEPVKTKLLYCVVLPWALHRHKNSLLCCVSVPLLSWHISCSVFQTRPLLIYGSVLQTFPFLCCCLCRHQYYAKTPLLQSQKCEKRWESSLSTKPSDSSFFFVFFFQSSRYNPQRLQNKELDFISIQLSFRGAWQQRMAASLLLKNGFSRFCCFFHEISLSQYWVSVVFWTGCWTRFCLIVHIVWSQHFCKYPHVLHPKQPMPPWKVDIKRLHTGHKCVGNLFGSMENHSVACWDPITIYYTGSPSQIAFIVSILIFISGFNSYCLYYVKRHSNVLQKQKDPLSLGTALE